MSTASETPVTTSADEVEVDAEAERLFAEAAAAREGEPAEKPADPAAEAAAAEPPNEAEAEVTTGEGDGEKPEGQSGGSEGAAATAAASGEGDIWADADPKLKAAFEEAAERASRAEHQFKSREGREAALQRELAKEREGKGQGQEQPRKPLKELLETDQIKAIVEEYPDFKPVIDAMTETADRLDGMSKEVGDVRSATVAVASSAEEKALNQVVPNWLELAQDERFMGWVDDQPKKIREAVSANWAAITDATAAAEVFSSFADHIKPAEPTKEPEGGAPSKRERQASGTKVATVTAPTSAGGESDDPEVIFAQAAAKKDRERGIKV